MHTVRHVLPIELFKYRDHLKGLDANSRRLRFSASVSDDKIDQAFASIELNADQHVIFCVENYALDFIGVAHIALGPPVELAISVLPEFQQQGVGTALMERVIQYCRTHDIQSVHIECLSANEAVRKLCNRYGIKMQINGVESTGKVAFSSIDIPASLGEMEYTTLGAMDYVMKRVLYPLAMIAKL
jgi:RimJ/RimL family protein N-acetyltransferase